MHRDLLRKAEGRPKWWDFDPVVLTMLPLGAVLMPFETGWRRIPKKV